MEIKVEEEEIILKTDSNLNSSENNYVNIKSDLKAKSKISDYSQHSAAIKYCDYFLVATVVQINVVGVWRGLFGILSYFHDFWALLLLHIFGSLIYLQFFLMRKTYKEYLKAKRIRNFVLHKIYTYTFGSACIMQWAGLWYILDELSGLDVIPPLVSSIMSILALIFLKLLKNILAPPCSVGIDSLNYFFDFPSAFKTNNNSKGSSETALYILDCFFSVFVVGSLVVIAWRGVWVLFDIYLFPEDEKYSAFVSLAIGYVIVLIIYCLQTPMEKLCQKLKGFWLILAADLYIFLSFIGTINSWRGIWNLLNIYFLPNWPLLSNWITHLGCFVFLVLIKCSNSVLVRGVFIDGENGGESVVFPIQYIRFFIEKQKQKKQAVKTVSLPI